MHKLLFDTNALLDIAVPSRPESHEAVVLLGRVDEGLDEGFVAASSLKDFYYLMRKHASEPTARNFVRLFMALLNVLPIDSSICTCALEGDEPDLEDGLIRAVAENEGVDFVITRDKTAFEKSRIKAVPPSIYLEMTGAHLNRTHWSTSGNKAELAENAMTASNSSSRKPVCAPIST